jgi:hypothetical protein
MENVLASEICKHCGKRIRKNHNGKFCSPSCSTSYAYETLKTYENYMYYEFHNTCRRGCEHNKDEGYL